LNEEAMAIWGLLRQMKKKKTKTKTKTKKKKKLFILYHTEHFYKFRSAGDHPQGIKPKQKDMNRN